MSATIKKSAQLRKEILKHLYSGLALSLNELSKLTQKSLPIVTTVVNDLIADGYMISDGLAPSSGGRRASMFLLNPKKERYIISVAVDQMVARMVIYNLTNQIQLPVQVTEIDTYNDVNALQKLVVFIAGNLEKSGLNRDHILGIGIGMPGFVNIEKGINYTIFPTAEGESLRDHLSSRLNLPVFIDNDSSLIGIAELKFGKAKGKQDVMVINLGWGTGLGMIIDGKIFRGHSGFAGEFSHIPLSGNDHLCSCGKRGCLEVETSLLVMARKAKVQVEAGVESSMKRLFLDKSKHDGDHFLAAARSGDPLAISILSEASFHLGKGVATLIHIMNPEKIVLSGRAAIAGKMFMPSIQQAINEFCIPRIAECTDIEISEIGNEAELLGAAHMVMERAESL
ncbi:ROK family protein [Pedobacter gandavensis]|uniref:ROK family protein n=1 Tax=Pedobacter gandavensis TaxID=2679963 RepID=UPI0029306939|nr:ROK family protein [Pedobacter gandavensis]